MQEGGGGERSDRTQAELGRLLSVAGGYRVLASDVVRVVSVPLVADVIQPADVPAYLALER